MACPDHTPSPNPPTALPSPSSPIYKDMKHLNSHYLSTDYYKNKWSKSYKSK